MNIIQTIQSWIRSLDRANRKKATEYLEYELNELESIFTILCFPGYTGIPETPVYSVMEILPLMKRELELAGSDNRNEEDTLSNLIGLFGID